MDKLEPADAVDSVCIRTCRDNMESNMVSSILSDAGIRCFVQGEHHRAMLGFMGPYIDLRVLVAQHGAQRGQTRHGKWSNERHRALESGESGAAAERPEAHDEAAKRPKRETAEASTLTAEIFGRVMGAAALTLHTSWSIDVLVALALALLSFRVASACAPLLDGMKTLS